MQEMKRKTPKNRKQNEYVELTNLIRDLITLVDRRFNLVENKIGAIDIGLQKAKEELHQQISGLGNRIDELALNRAKYSDMETIRRDIEKIQKQLARR